MKIEHGNYGVRFDGGGANLTFSDPEPGPAYSGTDIFHNGHIITVASYRDYANQKANETATFFEVMVDGDFVKQGFTSPERATAGAVDFIGDEVANVSAR